MSGDMTQPMVTRALEYGASYYLYKPLTYSDIQKLWQHVITHKLRLQDSEEDMEGRRSVCRDASRLERNTSRVVGSSSRGSSGYQETRKRKEPTRKQLDVGKRCSDRCAAPNSKKPRVVWTAELHNHFLDAIEILGIDKAVPKKILEYMRVPGLTRENVASHLQKYRIFVKKLVENDRCIQPNTVKSLASRAFHTNFASDEHMPEILPQNFSQQAPTYPFGSFQLGLGEGNLLGAHNQTRNSHRGPHTQSHTHPQTLGAHSQTHTSYLGTSMAGAGFQHGKLSITPMNNGNGLMGQARQPWCSTSFAAGNVSSFNHQNIVNMGNGNQNAATTGPSRSSISVSLAGGRSGRGTMKLVHQQNLMRWRNNVPSSGLLNPAGTPSVFESHNFQRQNSNAVVGNMGTTGSVIDSLFAGNSFQPSTLNSNNFTGIQIIRNNPNSCGTLHIGQVVSKPSNENNMDYSFINRPTSSVMEVPGMIPELFALQSSYPAIEVPNSNLDYLNIQPSSLAPMDVSNPIYGSSRMTNIVFTPQNEASFGGTSILSANHESLAPQQETQVPTVAVAPTPVVLESQEPELQTLATEQLGQETEKPREDGEDPFKGLLSLIMYDSDPGDNSLPSMENEDFADFFQDFEPSAADQDGALYDDQDFMDFDFDLSVCGVNNGTDDDNIFQF